MMKKIGYLGLIAIVATVLGCSGIDKADAEENKIPEWIKNIFIYYINGDIAESELISALEFLSDQGILKLGYDKYEKFSLDKFPDTDGFNPEWLKDQNQRLKQSCIEEKQIGYQSPFCKFVD